MIGEIGRWMLERACLDRARWAVLHREHDRSPSRSTCPPTS